MSRRPKRLGAVALAVSALLLAGACGGDNKVGDESILNFEEQVNEGLGNTTTTTAPPAATATTAPAGGTATTAPAGGKQPTATTVTTAQQSTATTKAVVTTTTQAPEQVLEIAVQSDSADKPIDPEYAVAYLNTKVRWTNKSDKTLVISSDTGEFRSPSMPPGAVFEWKAIQVGIFTYTEGARPYVKGTLQVEPAP